jgi:sulfur relay (sulfurtransferase) DsrF/TusC family protein
MVWALEITKNGQGLDRWVGMVEDFDTTGRVNFYILKNPFGFETKLEALLAALAVNASDGLILGDDMRLEMVNLVNEEDEIDLPDLTLEEIEKILVDQSGPTLEDDCVGITEWHAEHGITAHQGETVVPLKLMVTPDMPVKTSKEILEEIALTLEDMRLTVAELKANELRKLFAAEGLTVTDTEKAQEFLAQARSTPVESPSDTPFMTSGTY